MWRGWKPHSVLVGICSREALSLVGSQTVKPEVSTWGRLSLLGCVSMRRNEKVCPQKTSTWIVIAMLFIIAKMWEKYNCLSTDNWMNTSSVSAEWNVSCRKRVRGADTCCNMDEPWRHYWKWKKPSHKDHRLCDSVIRNVQSLQMYRYRKYISGYQGLDGEEKGRFS